jgi:hypothetical protein
VHAEAKSLVGIAARIRVVDLLRYWPNLADKGDVSDCIADGATAERLWKLVKKTVWSLCFTLPLPYCSPSSLGLRQETGMYGHR